MRKRLLLLIISILIICSVPVFAGNSNNMSVKINYAGYENNCYSTVNVNFSSEDLLDEDLYCFVALMNGDALYSVEVEEALKMTKLDKNIVLENVPADMKVRAYLWNKNLSPLINTGDVVESYDVYVSENGFRTIEDAKFHVREVKEIVNKNIVVHISEGVYYLEDTLCFTNEDSGDENYTVTYVGDAGTYIDGGEKIGKFSAVDGEEYLQADWCYDGYIYEMYVNGHRAKVASTEYKFVASSLYDDVSTEYGVDGFTFSGENALPFELRNHDGIMIANANEWKYMLVPISNVVSDEEKDTIVLSQPYFEWYSSNHSIAYPIQFINSMQFLDQPGEFYYDKDNSKIYYYPMDGETADNIEAHIPKLEKLIDISGDESNYVRNLNFENINLRHGQWLRTWEKGYSAWQAESYKDEWSSLNDYSRWNNIVPAQFEMSYVDTIKVYDCNFENMSAGAVRFDDNCINSELVGNMFYDIGGAAVTIGKPSHSSYYAFGDNANICKNIKIMNNLIRMTGQIYQSSCAITAYYVNNCEISNNDIKDCPYTGISLGWGWGFNEELCCNNIIANNKISDIMHSLWDGSHIYTLGKMKDTQIVGNYMTRTIEECGGGGYYPDQGSENILVKDNVFENAKTWNIAWGKGISYDNNYVTYLKEYASSTQISETERAGFIEYSMEQKPASATQILNSAGLKDEYKYLLGKYDVKHNKNKIITYLPTYFGDDFFCVEAGNFIKDGGEGVSYHDNEIDNLSDGIIEGPDVGGRMNRIMSAGTGEWLTYNINPPKTGYYDVYVLAATRAGKERCYLTLNDDKITNHTYLTFTGDWALYKKTKLGKMLLKENETNHLKIEFEVGINFGGFVFDFVEAYSNGEVERYEYVIDDTDEEFTFVGDNWVDKNGYTASYGFNTHKSLDPSHKDGGYAEVSVNCLNSGIYEVYSYVPVGNSTSLSKEVKVDVTCETGTSTVTYNSYQVPSGWVKLDGKYKIKTGDTMKVKLYCGDAYRSIRADAIKFVKVEEINTAYINN